jgi:putative membrane protein
VSDARPFAERAGPITPLERPARLNPLSPFVRGGRLLVSLVALAAYNLRAVRHLGVWATPVVLAIIVGWLGLNYLSWAFTRYRVADGDVRLESGVFIKRSRRVRIDRLQAVDVVQPLLGRVLGLAELKLDMAGGAEGRVRLSYLRLDEAMRLRASLLAMAAGLDHQTPEAPESPFLHCPGGAIVGGALLSTQAVFGALWIGAFVIVGAVTGKLDFLTGALPGILSTIQGVWQMIQRHYGFTLADSPDGLRLQHGLFETRSQTVPPGRVQAVRIVQPFLWRPFGWVRVDANIAGYAGRRAEEGREHNSVLLPVGSRQAALAVIARVLPGIDIDAVVMTRPPRRAMWHSPFRWFTYRAGAGTEVFAVRSGLLRRVHSVIRHGKIQSVRLSAGPFERLLGLASVAIHSTNGPVDVVARYRDPVEARWFVDTEAVLARSGRADAPPDRWMTASN